MADTAGSKNTAEETVLRTNEKKMKILFLGRMPDGTGDEGMKNALRHFSEGLSRHHSVRMIAPENLPGKRVKLPLKEFYNGI